MTAEQRASLVRVRGVDLRIGRTQVLSHVDLTVGSSEIVTLVGPPARSKAESTNAPVAIGVIANLLALRNIDAFLVVVSLLALPTN